MEFGGVETPDIEVSDNQLLSDSSCLLCLESSRKGKQSRVGKTVSRCYGGRIISSEFFGMS